MDNSIPLRDCFFLNKITNANFTLFLLRNFSRLEKRGPMDFDVIFWPFFFPILSEKFKMIQDNK